MLIPSALSPLPPWPVTTLHSHPKHNNIHPATLVIICISGFAALAPLVSGQGGQGGLQVGAPWSARGHDSMHSGRSPNSMGACPYGVEMVWEFSTNSWVESSPAIGADGTVYVGSGDGTLYALNGTSGAVRWSYATGNKVDSSPAIGADGTVYVGSVDTNVYALNGTTGTLRWNYTTGAAVSSSPAIAADGTVYVGSYDHNLYALNGSTGALRWRYTAVGSVFSSPAIGADGTVYVGALDYWMYALNGSTGALRWSCSLGAVVYSSPAIGADGTVYVGSYDQNLYALNASTGATIWRHTTDTPVVVSPAIGADGTVYVGSYAGKVYALNGSTGAVCWNYTFGGTSSSPTIGADGTVYMGSSDGKLYALNGSTGAVVWTDATSAVVVSTPAIGAGGAIYVASREGSKVYSLSCVRPPMPSLSLTTSWTSSPSLSYTPSRLATISAVGSMTFAAVAAQWSMQGGDMQHTGRSAFNGPQGPVVGTKWTFTSGNTVYGSPAIGADGTVYIGSFDHSVYALVGSTGAVKWTYATGDQVMSSPAIGANGTVLYVGSYDHFVYALDAGTGAQMWAFETGSAVSSSPVIGADGTVYIGSSDANLYALNGSTGTRKWNFTTGREVDCAPAIGPDGTVFMGSYDRYIYAVNGTTGALKWTFMTNGVVYSSPAIGVDGTVYAASRDSTLYALNGSSGALLWSFTTGDQLFSSPAIGEDGTVYVGSLDYNLYAVNGSTGAVKWNFTTRSFIVSSPISALDGTIYVGSCDFKVYAVNGTTGAHKWNFTTGNVVYGSPIIGMHGTVYVGSFDHSLYAISESFMVGSPSGTLSASTTVSPTTSALSMSSTGHPTASVTLSAVGTLTRTPTVSGSTGASFSGTWLSTSSVTVSASPSSALLPSTSPSIRPSPVPGSLYLSFLPEDAPQFSISDSLPPLTLLLHAPNCSVACPVSCTSAQVKISPASLTLERGAPTSLLSVWAPFGSCGKESGNTTLVCSVSHAEVSLVLRCRSTRWPLLADAIVLMRNGLARSAWAAAPFNVSQAASPEDVLRMQPNASVTVLPFTMVVNEGAKVLLISQRLSVPPFSSATQVFSNKYSCNVSWVSTDGWALLFDLPSLQYLCPDMLAAATADCGYIQVSISTHWDEKAAGATLACPPFCPHDFPGTIPVAIKAGSGISLVPGMVGDGSQPPVPLQLTSLPSTGFYMTQGCAAAGFLDPAVGACTNASDPRHVQCSFGAGSACRPCPSGSLWLGGFRAWPTVGYYTASESSGQVATCPPPAALRCLGWNMTTGAVQCGDGYTAGSYMCTSCASGFFPDLDGTCSHCPFNGPPSLLDVIQPILYFCGGLLAACGAMYAAVVAVARTRGATTKGLPKLMLQLAAWIFTTVQVVAQVGRAASPGLPPMVLAVYSQLSIFQFRGVALPSACVPGFQFLNEVASMSVAIALMSFAGCLVWKLTRKPLPVNSHPPSRRVVAAMFRATILALTVLYATVTNGVISVLHCVDADVTEAAYAALTGRTTPFALVARSTSTVTVSLLQSNPSIVCYNGLHATAAAVAWATLTVYCVAFPCLTVWLVHLRMQMLQKKRHPDTATGAVTKPAARSVGNCARWFLHVSPHSSSAPCNTPGIEADALLAPFTAGDYHPSVFWFPVVDRAYFVVLAVSQALLPVTSTVARFLITSTTLVCMTVLLLLYRPFVHSWKFIAKVYCLLLCLLAAVLNLLTAQDDSSSAIEPLAFLVVIASGGLFLAMGAAFVHDITRLMSLKPAALQPGPQLYDNPLLDVGATHGPRQSHRIRIQSGAEAPAPDATGGSQTNPRQPQARGSVAVRMSPMLSRSAKLRVSGGDKF